MGAPPFENIQKVLPLQRRNDEKAPREAEIRKRPWYICKVIYKTRKMIYLQYVSCYEYTEGLLIEYLEQLADRYIDFDFDPFTNSRTELWAPIANIRRIYPVGEDGQVIRIFRDRAFGRSRICA